MKKDMKLNKKIKNFLKKSKLIINLYQIITAIKLLIFDVCSSLLSRSLKVKMTPYGFKLLGSNLVHHIDMQNGVFEPDETTLFKDIFKGIDIFVDVGANIGFYACMARAAGLHVIAIEPQQKNLKYLYANIRENEWSDVEIFPVGLASQYGIATLFGGSSTGASLISNWAGASKMFHQIIPLSTLDILLGGRFLGKKIFIKIDVEGAEYSALLGGITLMDMLPKPTWVVEICLNEYHPEGINPNFEEIFKLFWRHGYEARTADKKDQIILQKDIDLWIKNGKCDSETINYKFTPIE